MRLIDLLKKIGSIPGRLEELQYEHTVPVERQPDVPMDLGGEEIMAPPPELTRPGAPVRTGRLSRFGQFMQQGLPEIVRGAVVAASSPTPGAVGTAGDIFGALGAVDRDRQERSDRLFQRGRIMEQDATRQRLDAARALESEADAAMKWNRAGQEIGGRRGAQRFEEVYDQAFQRAKKAGLEDSEAHGHAMAAWSRNPTGYIKAEPRSLDAFKATLQAQFARGEIDETEYQAAIKRIAEAESSIAKAKAGGTAQGKAENTPVADKLTPTFKGLVWSRPPLATATGKVLREGSMSEPVAQPPERKAPPPRPSRPRYRFETDDQGRKVRINVDTNETEVVPNFTPKPTGKTATNDVALFQALGIEQPQTQSAKMKYKFTREYNGSTYGRNSESEPWKKIK
jgi:hypothetical protein